MRRLTSLDQGYKHGQLSVFPAAIDTPESLFHATNNAETILKHGITTNSRYIIVENASAFSPTGLLKITAESGENEIIYYGGKSGNQFHLLQRSYHGSRHGPWAAGSIVTSPIMAEHHNVLKDAILKIQYKLGLVSSPDPKSVHGMVRSMEQKWLAPKVIFKSFPKTGPNPLNVHFRNFSTGFGTRFLWDFGDGTTSTDKHPVHTYLEEGSYTVKLNMITTAGASGVAEKPNYIIVNNNQRTPFFYGRPLFGYNKATEFTFVDQTEGNISERHWFFGDGTDVTINDPNIHTIKHVYDKSGDYQPILMIRYTDGILSRANIMEGIIVL